MDYISKEARTLISICMVLHISSKYYPDLSRSYEYIDLSCYLANREIHKINDPNIYIPEGYLVDVYFLRDQIKILNAIFQNDKVEKWLDILDRNLDELTSESE